MQDLCVGYKGPVVGPLSFSVAPGEVVGLSGSNGAGKSTILRAITGEASVFGGRYRIHPGLRIASLPQQLPDLGELPLRARELLSLYERDAAGAADDTVLPPPLSALLGQRIDRLSGGQRQILYVCAALRQRAELTLLDEPTNNLDPDAEAWLAQALRARDPARALLVISHETRFLNEVCDRIVHVDR